VGGPTADPTGASDVGDIGVEHAGALAAACTRAAATSSPAWLLQQCLDIVHRRNHWKRSLTSICRRTAADF
jgi:hypothetical protein